MPNIDYASVRAIFTRKVPVEHLLAPIHQRKRTIPIEKNIYSQTDVNHFWDDCDPHTEMSRMGKVEMSDLAPLS